MCPNQYVTLRGLLNLAFDLWISRIDGTLTRICESNEGTILGILKWGHEVNVVGISNRLYESNMMAWHGKRENEASQGANGKQAPKWLYKQRFSWVKEIEGHGRTR